jgi:hypothetical protein
MTPLQVVRDLIQRGEELGVLNASLANGRRL